MTSYIEAKAREIAQGYVELGRDVPARIVTPLLDRIVDLETDKASVAAIWRRGIGDAVASIDLLKNELRTSRRKAERELGIRLDALLQAIFDARMLRDPDTYEQAAEAGQCLQSAARTLLSHREDAGE